VLFSRVRGVKNNGRGSGDAKEGRNDTRKIRTQNTAEKGANSTKHHKKPQKVFLNRPLLHYGRNVFRTEGVRGDPSEKPQQAED